MPKKPITQEDLLLELEDMRARLNEAEETLRTIRNGEVDALIVPGARGEQIFTLKSADYIYRMLIEEMNDGALTLAADGQILYANRRFAEMLKTPLEKVIGSTIYTWIAPDDQKFLQSLLTKGANEKSRDQLALTAGDGTQVPVDLSVSNLIIDGMPDSFCLVATDLTEQKRSDAIAASEKLAQELLAASNQSRLELLRVIEDQKRAEQALQKSEEKFRNLFQNHSAAKLIIDPVTGDIVEANRSAERFYGWSVEQLKEMRIQDINMLSGEQVKAELEKARSLERTYFEFRHRLSDGSFREVGVYSGKIDINGKGLLHSIIHDITERKRTEEQKDSLVSDLQKALSEVKTLRGFLPICSHCKKIRDDKGYWNQIESYIREHSEVEFSHSICQECAKRYYPDMDLYDE